MSPTHPEVTKLLGRSKTTCAAVARELDEFFRRFRGDDGIARRLVKIIHEIDGTVKELKAKAAAAQVNQAEAQAAIESMLARMRPLKTELEKMAKELQEIRIAIEASAKRNSELAAPIGVVKKDLQREKRELPEAIQRLEEHKVRWQQQLAAGHQQFKIQIERANSSIALHQEGIKKAGDGLDQIAVIERDLQKDRQAYHGAANDWSAIMHKRDVAIAEVQVNDKANFAKLPQDEQQRIVKALDQAGREVPGRPKPEAAPAQAGATPAATAGTPGDPKVRQIQQTDQDKQLEAHMGRRDQSLWDPQADAARRFLLTKGYTEKQIANGEVPVTVFAGTDFTEQTLRRAQEAMREDLYRRLDTVGQGDERKLQDRAEMAGIIDAYDTAKSQVVGLKAEAHYSGLHIVPEYKLQEAELEKFKTAAKPYNEKMEALQASKPEVFEYLTRELGLPTRLEPDKLAFNAAQGTHVGVFSGQWAGGGTNTIVDGIAGGVKSAGNWFREWNGTVVEAREDGIGRIARERLTGTDTNFLNRYDENQVSLMRAVNFRANGAWEANGLWENVGLWRDTGGQERAFKNLVSGGGTVNDYSSNGANMEEQIARHINSRDRFEAAQAANLPAAELAAEKERFYEEATNATRRHSVYAGEVAAHNTRAAGELLEMTKIEAGYSLTAGWHGNNRWQRQERQEFVTETGISTASGFLLQDVVAGREAIRATDLAVAARTYSWSTELFNDSAEAKKSADLNSSLTVLGGALHVTPFTSVGGVAWKSLNAARHLDGADNIVTAGARVVNDIPPPRAPDNFVPHTRGPEIPRPEEAPTVGPWSHPPERPRAPDYQPPEPVVASKDPPPLAPRQLDNPPEPVAVRPHSGSPDLVPAVPERAPAGPAAPHNGPASPTRFADNSVPSGGGPRLGETVRPAAFTGEQVASRASTITQQVGQAVGEAGSRAARVVDPKLGDNVVEAASKGAVPSATSVPSVPLRAAAVEAAPQVSRTASVGSSMSDWLKSKLAGTFSRTADSAPAAEGRSLGTAASRPMATAERAAQNAPSPAALPSGPARAAESLPKAMPTAHEAHLAARTTDNAGQAVQALEASANGTRPLLSNADNAGRNLAKLTDNAAEATAKGADNALEAAGRNVDNAAEAAARKLAKSGDDALEAGAKVGPPVPAPVPGKIAAATATGVRALHAAEATARDGAIVASKRSFLGEIANWTSKKHIFSRMANALAEVEQLKGLQKTNNAAFKEIARSKGWSEAKLARKLEKHSKYFQHRLAEKYAIPAKVAEKFAEGFREGRHLLDDAPDLVKALAREGQVNNWVARPKIVALERNLREAFKEAIKTGDTAKLTKLLNATDLPKDLAGRVAAAVTEGKNLKGLLREQFLDGIPIIARSLAEEAVLLKTAPTIGRLGSENLKLLFTHPLRLAAGVSARYVQSPFVRMGQWIGSFRNPINASKSFATMTNEARFGMVIGTRGSAAAEDISEAVAFLQKANRASKVVDEVAEGAAEGSTKSETAVNAAIKSDYPQRSLLAQAASDAKLISRHVENILQAGDEPDLARRAAQVEAARFALQESGVPKHQIESLMKTGGEFAYAGRKPLTEEVAALAEQTAQSKYFSQRAVSNKLDSIERSIGSALKASDPEKQASRLQKLGLDEITVKELVAASADNAAGLKSSGQLRKSAEAILLQDDASSALKSKFTLNAYERSRRVTVGTIAVAKAIVGGSIYGSLWLAKQALDPREYASKARRIAAYYRVAPVPEVPYRAPAGVKGVDSLFRYERDSGMAAITTRKIIGMIDGGADEAGIAKLTSVLEKHGFDPISVQNLRRAMEKDIENVRLATAGNPEALASDGELAKIVGLARADEYEKILMAGRKVNGTEGAERSAELTRSLANFNGMDNSGTRTAGQATARWLDQNTYVPVSRDASVRLGEIREIKRIVDGYDLELDDAGRLGLIKEELEKRYPKRNFDSLFNEQNAPTAFGRDVLEDRGMLRVKWVADNGGPSIQKNADGTWNLKLTDRILEENRMGDRSGLNHERAHYETVLRINRIESELASGVSAERKAVLEAELMEAYSHVAVFEAPDSKIRKLVSELASGADDEGRAKILGELKKSYDAHPEFKGSDFAARLDELDRDLAKQADVSRRVDAGQLSRDAAEARIIDRNIDREIDAIHAEIAHSGRFDPEWGGLFDIAAANRSAYGRLYRADEALAFLEQSRTELATARKLLSGESTAEARLRAAASVVWAQRMQAFGKVVAETNAEKFTQAKAALEGGAKINYDKFTGTAVIEAGTDAKRFKVSVEMGRNLTEEQARARFLKIADASVERVSKQLADRSEYLQGQIADLGSRVRDNSFGKTMLAKSGQTSTARGREVITEAAQARMEPSVRAALRAREAADLAQSDARRARLQEVVAPGERLQLLREEEDFLAYRLAKAQAEVAEGGGEKAKQAVVLAERAHAHAAARYLGERAARETNLAAGSVPVGDSVKAVAGKIEEQVMGPYLKKYFPGLTPAQVQADPEKMAALLEFRSRDLAKAQRNAHAAEDSLARVLTKQIPDVNEEIAAKRMARELVQAQAVASNSEPAKSSQALAQHLFQKGWSREQIDACYRIAVCGGTLPARPAHLVANEPSPLALKVLADAEAAKPGAAGRARAEQFLGGAGPKQSAGVKQAIEEAEAQSKALAKELADRKKAVTRDPSAAAAIKTVEDAAKASKARVAALKKLESEVLDAPAKIGDRHDDLRALAKAEVKRQLGSSDAMEKISAVDSGVADIFKMPAGNPAQADARFTAFTQAVDALDPAKRRELYRVVENNALDGKSVLGNGLRAAGELKPDALGAAVKASDDVMAASLPAELSQKAAARHIGGERLALAEATGVVRAEKTAAEAAQDLAADLKQAKAEREALQKANVRLAENAEGRKLASIADLADGPSRALDLEVAARAKLLDTGVVSEKNTAELAKAMAILEKDNAGLERVANRLANLATEPDSQELYRMAYVAASRAYREAKSEKAGAKDSSLAAQKAAWEEGLRSVLRKAGYTEKDLETADSPLAKLRTCFPI